MAGLIHRSVIHFGMEVSIMNVIRKLIPALAIFLPLTALADSWKDESGQGRGYGREYKEEYWDGNCKVERKFEKSGEYKEERKCKGLRQGYYGAAPVYVPAPPPIVIQPGVTVHGTVHIPQ